MKIREMRLTWKLLAAQARSGGAMSRAALLYLQRVIILSEFEVKTESSRTSLITLLCFISLLKPFPCK